VGWKIAATSEAIQGKYGVDHPFYGFVMEEHLLAPGGAAVLADFLNPLLEAEVAFIFGRDLSGPGVSAEDVTAAVSHYAPAFEIPDFYFRGEDWHFSDSIPMNVFCGAVMLGRERAAAADVDLGAVELSMIVDGELRGREKSTAVMGHPARAVAWLANALAECGEGIRAGQAVISGSFMLETGLRPGMRVRAEFSGIGGEEISFA
jgi:2-keto-4-pentenoate hydratase